MEIKVNYSSPLLRVLIPGSLVILGTGAVLFCGFTLLKISGIMLSIAFGTVTLFIVTLAVFLAGPLISKIADLPAGTLSTSDSRISWSAGMNRGEISLAGPHIAEIFTGETVSGEGRTGAGITIRNKESAISVAMPGIDADEIFTVIDDRNFPISMPLALTIPFFPFRLSFRGEERVEFFNILSLIWENRDNNLAYVSHCRFPWNHVAAQEREYAEILDPADRKENAIINRIRKQSIFSYKEKLFLSPDYILAELDISAPAKNHKEPVSFYCLMPVGITEACMESEYDADSGPGQASRLALHSIDNEGKNIRVLFEWPERKPMSTEYLDIENLMKYLTEKKRPAAETGESSL